jgi:hypothetical protein
VPFDRTADLGNGRSSIVPTLRLGVDAFELLVRGEEVFHFAKIVTGHVVQVVVFGEKRVGIRYAQNFEIVQAAVLHAKQADDASLNQTAAERRLVDHHQNIEGVAVFGQRLRNKAVVARIVA